MSKLPSYAGPGQTEQHLDNTGYLQRSEPRPTRQSQARRSLRHCGRVPGVSPEWRYSIYLTECYVVPADSLALPAIAGQSGPSHRDTNLLYYGTARLPDIQESALASPCLAGI